MIEETQRTRLRVARLFTTPGVDPYDLVQWTHRDAVIANADGEEKFRQDGIEVPAFWSERATNIVAEKYFRVIGGVKETSVKQMLRRISLTITAAGVSQKVFATQEDAEAFEAELRYMLLQQMFAFNSPVWFNVGVVEKPQASACFIQSVEDTMESITDLAKKEIRLFKGGSGTGTNISNLRSSREKLSGGGYASGPVSFMKVYDSGAGVTKSGGTTRRAAKMVIMNAEHPDILEQRDGTPGFITCKAWAEQLAQDLFATGKYSAEFNVPNNIYDIVPFQNANNSVRVSSSFMQLVEDGKGVWNTHRVTTKEVVERYDIKHLWGELVKAAWFCGDPGLQFDDIINAWHTCKASGRINASNPCSEFMFLDNSACNLGSLNLMKFLEGDKFEAVSFAHASKIALTAMEVLVDFSGYPSVEIAENSHKYRPLGLGYANLGSLLLVKGIAYDSVKGREYAAAITALMTGAAYAQSALLAEVQGPFDEHEKNKESMAEVIAKHANALDNIEDEDQELEEILDEAERQWSVASQLGDLYGFRNSQVSLLAPTGTISFIMDCDSTGIEPFLALVIYKKLVGGGSVKMTNRLVERALQTLGYSDGSVKQILAHIEETGDVVGCSLLRPKDLPVFATAIGANAISPEGHLKMMGAVQPFLSGAISKTVNLARTATVQDVSDAYLLAWKLGLKAIAIFRDGCKLSQPAGTKLETALYGESVEEEQKQLAWGERKKLPPTRHSITHKMRIGSAEGYIMAGKHEDGKLGEVFITMAQEGSTLRGFMDLAATAISIGLQHGVPVDTFIEKMKHMKFEPAGFTDHPEIRMAQSIPDYIGRWLELEFVKKALTPAAPTAAESPVSEEVLRKEVVTQGYNGPPCSKCGNLTQRAGTCYVCTSCGTTSGCS